MARRTVLSRLGLALGLALFGYQFWIALSTLQDTPGTIVRPGLLAAAVALDLAAFATLSISWWILIGAVWGRLRLLTIVEGYALSFLPRYIPGTVWGYLSRGEWLKQSSNIGYGHTSLASLLEIGMQFGTAVTVAAIWIAPEDLRLGVGLLLILLLAGGWWGTLRFGARKLGTVPSYAWSAWLAGLFFGLCLWGLQGVALHLTVSAIGVDCCLTPAGAVFIFAASWIVGFVAIFVPAGLGIREWTMASLLVSVGGLTQSNASLAAVLMRLALLAAELMMLAIGLALRYYRRRICT